MTNEEIEKQADCYVNKYYKEPNSVMNIDEITEVMVKQALKDGAKWGMEHAIEWHDLRENPNDLPKVKGYYWVVTYYCSEGTKSYFNHSEMEFNEGCVIAWCELPKLKE